MDKQELDDIHSRFEHAERLLERSTWPGRVGNYGPAVAQAVLRSFADIPRLLKALEGRVDGQP